MLHVCENEAVASIHVRVIHAGPTGISRSHPDHTPKHTPEHTPEHTEGAMNGYELLLQHFAGGTSFGAA